MIRPFKNSDLDDIQRMRESINNIKIQSADYKCLLVHQKFARQFFNDFFSIKHLSQT